MGKPVTDKQKKGLKPPFEIGNKIAEKPFNRIDFEKLCALNCTEQEIMYFFRFKDHKTLNAKVMTEYGGTYEQIYPIYAIDGNISLRRSQQQSAMGYPITIKGLDGKEQLTGFIVPPNPSMQIWLGKQRLGQKDLQNIDHTSGGEKIVVILPPIGLKPIEGDDAV